jgi:hypothetical protein
MDREHVRSFANRDWGAIARAKREHQTRLFREHGPAATLRIAREHIREILGALERALDRSDLTVALDAALAEVG